MSPAPRQKWDRRFIDMAQLVASWSKDPSLKVGAVIVRPDQTIASLGYNGFPRGLSDAPELYANREIKLSRVVHAELNAILNAQGPVYGCTIYITALPCDRCAVHVIQAGIKRVVCLEPTPALIERWGKAFEETRAMFKEAGVEVVELPEEPKPEIGLEVEDTLPLRNSPMRGNYLQIDVRMPSVDGQRMGHARYLIDGMVLDQQYGAEMGSDDGRISFVERVTKKIAAVATFAA